MVSRGLICFSPFLAYYVAWVHKIPCENRETDSKRRMKVKGPSQAITCNQRHQNTSSYLMSPKLHLLLWYLLLSSVWAGFRLHWTHYTAGSQSFYCWHAYFWSSACSLRVSWWYLHQFAISSPQLVLNKSVVCPLQACFLQMSTPQLMLLSPTSQYGQKRWVFPDSCTHFPFLFKVDFSHPWICLESLSSSLFPPLLI